LYTGLQWSDLGPQKIQPPPVRPRPRVESFNALLNFAILLWRRKSEDARLRPVDDSKKQTIALCAAFIAAPRLMFLDQDSAPALRAVLSDSVWKAELLLEHIDARGPNRNATRPAAKTDPYFDLKNELHAGPPPSVKNGPKPETKNEPTLKIVAPR
jgi:hypothetical protein